MQDDKHREWLEEKRSWIFFKDKIAEEDNIIIDSIEGNTFMLDCESARLSVWSEEWNTFVDVGVSSLLKEESTARKTGKVMSSAEIRIFYKGMELEKRSVRQDAGIIEFIDIKNDLEREYINISRGGFTRKGGQYFENKLYPGLLDAVRKVLKYLATSSADKNKGNFSDKIVRILEEKCEEFIRLKENNEKRADMELAKSRNSIISLTISVSVLAYYSVRDEWNIAETLDVLEYYESNAWMDLVKEIERILTESKDEFILSELANATKFFDLKVYGENHRQKDNNVKDAKLRFKFRFTQIFLEENQWAVIQVRKDAFSHWTSYLILLDEENKKIISFPHTGVDCEQLEEWGKRLCDVVNWSDDEADSSQQFIMNWMLKNLPTVGLFSNEEGNVRVNILARRIYPSIFLNDNFKYLILNRMMERAETDGIQRFSTITWQGKENLGCAQLPFNIYFIKRGYFSACSCHKSIVPFEGNLLKSWKEIIENPSEIEQKITSLIRLIDIRYYLEQESTDYHVNEEIRGLLRRQEKRDELRWSLSISISEFVVMYILNGDLRPEYCEIDMLLKKMDAVGEEEWAAMALDLVKFGIFAWSSEKESVNESFELRDKIQGNEIFHIFCGAWQYLVLKTDRVYDVMNGIKEGYQRYIDVNPSYQIKKEKIADYLIDEVPYKFNKERMLRYIDAYECELLNLFHNMECRRVHKNIDDLFERNKYLVSKLRQESDRR